MSLLEKHLANAQSATRDATKSFTRTRSRPIAGVGIVATAIWTTRVTFGVKLPRLDLLVWSLIAVVVLGMAALLYRLAAVQQHQDERLLRALYDPAVQMQALGACMTNSNALEREENGFIVSKQDILRNEYKHFLQATAKRDLRSMVEDVAPRRPLKLMPHRDQDTGRLMNLSAVDLEAALDNASHQALIYLVEIGLLKYTIKIGWREAFVWEQITRRAPDEDIEADNADGDTGLD